MPTPRITMRQLRQTLRLHFESGLSLRECSQLLGLGKSTVGDIVRNARAAGVDWALAQRLSDEELQARLYRAAVPRAARHLEPDYARIHQELKRPGVTLQLLWEEYSRANALAYKYTSFCVKYREWAAGLKRSMRQLHLAGEKLFVDYAGQTVPIVEASSGEIRAAQIFVAVTLITSQLAVANWHAWLDDPTVADAILDRIVHRSHRIELKGPSLRKGEESAP
jgi:glycine/D-amino acid oxidase-like deaminating enzyme